LSRTLKEELKFDRSRVTSLDWASYPILTFPEVPDIVMDLIDRPVAGRRNARLPSGSVRRKLEATSEIPRLEKTTGRDGRARPATTKGKSRAPSQKAGGIAGRTVTAEVDPAASAERRKQEYTADESEREAMTAKDAALREFDGHVLRLAQIINRAEPERFARTSVDVDKLLQLSRFLAEVAGQQPQRADGHSAA